MRQIPVAGMYGKGVIVASQYLLKVSKEDTADPAAWADVLGSDALELWLWVTAQETVDGVPRPEYYWSGFQSIGDSLVQLLPEQVEAARASKSSDVMIVSEPRLQMWRNEAGDDMNRAKLDLLAKELAPRYVRSTATSQPTETRAIGFVGEVETSGLIAEVAYTQTPPTTTIKYLSWWIPSGNYLSFSDEKSQGASGESYPDQVKTA